MNNLCSIKSLIFVYASSVLFLVAAKTGVKELDTEFTLRSTWGRLHLPSTGADTVIRCTSYDKDPSEMRFGRVMDAGHGLDLPSFHREFASKKPPYGRALHMGSINGSIRFGAYFCEEQQGDKFVRITTLKLPPFRIADIDPETPYKVVNSGDNVTIVMKELVNKSKKILWLKNGTDAIPEWTNKLKVNIANVTLEHRGVYECYHEDERQLGLHGIMRLIVRACPAGLYGPSCSSTCQQCYSGGRCHDLTGDCICPPGFNGKQCEHACGGNKFGAKCEQICFKPPSTVGANQMNPETGCKFFLFCKIDPFGCSCAPGFQGSMCDTDCKPGYYGPDCSQKCHCKDDYPCHVITGHCPSDKCDHGWSGESCQIFKKDEVKPKVLVAHNVESNTGAIAKVKCTAGGYPSPSVSLSYNNGTKVSDGVKSNNETYSTVISKVSSETSGEIKINCNATNSHGFDTKEIVIAVVDPPQIQTKPLLTNRTANVLYVQWFNWEYGKDFGGLANDRPDYKPVYRLNNRSNWEQSMNWTKSNSSVVKNLWPNKEYQIAILCRRPGANGDGLPGPYAIFSTDCGDVSPASAPDLKVVNTTATSITISWEEPDKDSYQCVLTGYKLSYGTMLHSVEPNHTVSIQADVPLVYAIRNLKPHTEYHIKLHLVTTKGATKYPGLITHHTNESVPGPVSNVSHVYSSSSFDKLTLHWKDPVKPNGIITKYVITLVVLNLKMCGIASQDPPKVLRSITNQVEVDNLEAFSAYSIIIQAATNVGMGTALNYSLVSSQTVPSNAPSNVRVSYINQTSMKVEWDNIPCMQTNGVVHSYEIQFSRFLVRNKRKIPADLFLQNATDLFIVLDDLQPNTEYDSKVRAYTKAGAGPFSDGVRNKTLIDVPKDVKVSIITTESKYLYVNWTNPSHEAPVSQYELKFWPLGEPNNTVIKIINVTVNNDQQSSPMNFYNITVLIPMTDYNVQVRARNSAGTSSWSDVVKIQTVEEFAAAPSQLKLLYKTDVSLQFVWTPPKIPSLSTVTGYKIVVTGVYIKSAREKIFFFTSLRVDMRTTNVTIYNLKAKTPYLVKVYSVNSRGLGGFVSNRFKTYPEESRVAPIPILMEDVASDNKIPIVFRVVNQTDVIKSERIFQVVVSRGQSTNVNQSILMDHNNATKYGLPYYIAAELPNLDPGDHRFLLGDESIYNGYTNVPLESNHEYNAWIRVIYLHRLGSVAVLSSPSKPILFESLGSYVVEKDDELIVFGMPLLFFILIVLAALLFIMLCTCCIACMIRNYGRKKRQGAYTVSHISRSNSWQVSYRTSDKDSNIYLDTFDDGPVIRRKSKGLKNSFRRHSSKGFSVPVQLFPTYVKEKYASNVDNFSEEFKILPYGQMSSWSCAKKPENVQKNRYGNILPYNHSRVVLKCKGRYSDDDYINANYIDGMYKKKEYIVTQGPKQNTIVDFWRMVWQERSSSIVMLTNLEENNKPKCYQYWPDDSDYYGDIQVMKIHKQETPELTVQTFLIRKPKLDETRRVVQYRYKNWLDKSVPPDVTELLRLRNQIRDDLPNNAGPIIVHCSAGVGRAGTFIAIDALLQQAERDKKIGVFNYVRKIRNQCMNLVQTLEQYVFLHEALLEAVVTGDTQVSLEQFPEYFSNLLQTTDDGTTTPLQQQYSMITRLAKRQIITGNNDRVSFLPYIDEDCSVNIPDSLLIEGDEKDVSYLVTRTPSIDAYGDFWDMIYRHKSSVIVMICNPSAVSNREHVQYWPEDGCHQYGRYQVHVVTFESLTHVNVRTMKLIHNEVPDNKPHIVIHLQYIEWPDDQLLPASTKSIGMLLDYINRWNQRTNNKGPITIHCRDGASQSGLICALFNIKQEINRRGSIDVFRICKRLCTTHINFIATLEQYRYCYEVALYIYNCNKFYA